MYGEDLREGIRVVQVCRCVGVCRCGTHGY